MTLLLLKLQYLFRYYRIMWGKNFTSFDLLELALAATRILKHVDDEQFVAWLKDDLLPELDMVRDWALEQIQEAGR